jgi:CelD/BcsL family acetyltransferase involved in cellulose biosynthesis
MKKTRASGNSMRQRTDTYETVTEERAVRALESEWDALHACSREHRFSRSFRWCWTTWEAVERPQGCRLYVLVAREGTRATLIWPFVVTRELCWRVARPLGAAYGEYADALVEDGPEADTRLAAAWHQVRAHCPADLVIVPWVRADSALHRLLESERDARVTGSVTSLAVQWSPEQDWESYERARGPELRRHLRKGQRELAPLGRLEFEVTEGGSRCVEVVEWLLPRKVQQLKVSHRRGPWLETEAYRNLLCEAAMRPSPSGGLATFALKVDGRLIAALMARRDARRIEMLNTVFDPAYARYRPGHVLMANVLRWTLARRLDCDLRIGDFQYKRRWSNTACDAVTYVCVNSRMGRVQLAYRTMRERLRRARRRFRNRLRGVLGRRSAPAG